MSRPVKVPPYRKHSPSRQAVVTLTGPANRKDVYLGPYGSRESHTNYARVIAEWAGTVAGPTGSDRQNSFGSFSVNELILSFWDHCRQCYVKNGRPTSEQHNYKAALKPLRLLYGATAAAGFTPTALKSLREHFVSQDLCRNEVNRRVRLVRSVFKWGVAEGLIPVAVWDALRAVAGLRRGRTRLAGIAAGSTC